jgi:hypothetical protein
MAPSRLKVFHPQSCGSHLSRSGYSFAEGYAATRCRGQTRHQRLVLPLKAAAALFSWLVPDGSAGFPASGNWWNQSILSGWDIIHSYDTAKECEKARADFTADAAKRGPRSDPLYGAQPLPEVCVASDDPRLKLPWPTH